MKSHNAMPESEYRTILESIGHGTRGVAVLNPSGPWYDLLALTHGSDSAGQRVADHPAIPMILTLVAKTIELQRIMASLRQRYAAALMALDHLGLGVVLTNRNAEVVLANREGQRILDAKDGLGMNARRQLMAGEEANARLYAAIRDTFSPASPAEGAPATSPIPVARPSGAYDLLVSISPMHDSEAELEPGLRTAFVLIVDPAKQGSLNAAGLTALGQLTRAESDVADHLVSGKSIKEIAAVRDTSALTVRGQVKTVAAKLRCRSQTDIIRLAAITRLPIVDD